MRWLIFIKTFSKNKFSQIKNLKTNFTDNKGFHKKVILIDDHK